MRRGYRCLLFAVALCLPSVVFAQDDRAFDVSGHVVTATVRQLDAKEIDISARAGWRSLDLLSLEAEVGYLPANLPRPFAVTASRTEFVAGVTAGPTLGAIRPFVRFRPGVLRFSAAPQPVACILIFPPPLACQLASGQSLLLFDIGGGVELNVSARSFVRLDLGDRLARYPGPSFDRDRRVHDSSYFGHDVRMAIGAGWRF